MQYQYKFYNNLTGILKTFDNTLGEAVDPKKQRESFILKNKMEKHFDNFGEAVNILEEIKKKPSVSTLQMSNSDSNGTKNVQSNSSPKVETKAKPEKKNLRKF